MEVIKENPPPESLVAPEKTAAISLSRLSFLRKNLTLVFAVVFFLFSAGVAVFAFTHYGRRPPSADKAAVPSPAEEEEPTPTPEKLPTPKPTRKPTVTLRPKPTATPQPTATPIPTTGTISGHVRRPDGSAVAGATIEIYCDCNYLQNGASQTTLSDSEGFYRFNDIRPGSYRIAAISVYWSSTYNISVEIGKTTSVDIVLSPDPTAIPQTAIISGPALRTDPGDPANFYCTYLRITVQRCCASLKIAEAYDNSNPTFSDLGSCVSPKETYLCEPLSSGQHTFYYRAKNDTCAEESLRSVSFTVP